MIPAVFELTTTCLLCRRPWRGRWWASGSVTAARWSGLAAPTPPTPPPPSLSGLRPVVYARPRNSEHPTRTAHYTCETAGPSQYIDWDRDRRVSPERLYETNWLELVIRNMMPESALRLCADGRETHVFLLVKLGINTRTRSIESGGSMPTAQSVVLHIYAGFSAIAIHLEIRNWISN